MRLDKFAEAAEVDKADVLRTIKAVLAVAQQRSQRATQRISQIEHLVQLRIPRTTSNAQGLGAPLDGDTLFCTVQIGGNNHNLISTDRGFEDKRHRADGESQEYGSHLQRKGVCFRI